MANLQHKFGIITLPIASGRANSFNVIKATTAPIVQTYQQHDNKRVIKKKSVLLV